ncbi:fasciclin-like arabinogalactan protein 11 [Tripterygium wilfordii]|uniref:Fasciclin-like arabinogalactan protein 11 n=1 Tax=Tripterygium wilfordii TaxID=458696 RepID=A0A7J7CU13_TRIWF|nr:fasciclin-like arabinogalactan protein 11 [Tripterygium wilfordii]KAF5737573.1 fasciclin-like arabinogalactan protein 11 [Tripterygium wilfordii]
MTKQVALPFFLLSIFFFLCTTTLAQTPAPAPAGPTNITAVLEKAGQFTTFTRLLKATQMADQINTQLNNSNQGLTIFAPTDNAFSSLKSGTLNSLTDQQKVQLVQFHVLPNIYSTSQFQTVSNPLRTQAGNSGNGEFPLNVTTSGNNQVNISTGVNTATVANTIYTDSQLAVYQVDQVLLPLDIFGVQAPAPAPVTADKDLPSKAPSKSSDTTNDGDTSGAMSLSYNVVAVISFSFALIAATSLQL